MGQPVRPWHQRDPSFYAREKALIAAQYPGLRYAEVDDKVLLSGTLAVSVSVEGQIIKDEYQISVEFPDDYPGSLPLVREVGGRKERTTSKWSLNGGIIDLHYNTATGAVQGSACLCARVLEGMYLPREIRTIALFIEKLVVPFFCNQSHFEATGTWLNGEYSHGVAGIWEAYADILGIADRQLIMATLEVLEEKRTVKGHWLCLCGSGRRVRDCHPSLLESASRLLQVSTLRRVGEDLVCLRNAPARNAQPGTG